MSKVCDKVCECHKIKWDFDTLELDHTYRGEPEEKFNISCQTKVNNRDWTFQEYFDRCKVYESNNLKMINLMNRKKK